MSLSVKTTIEGILPGPRFRWSGDQFVKEVVAVLWVGSWFFSPAGVRHNVYSFTSGATFSVALVSAWTSSGDPPEGDFP